MAASGESAAELVARMLAAYAGASAYADRGKAVTLGISAVVFQTALVRGQRFRFEYRDDHGSHVIWSDGVATYEHRPGMARIGRPEMVDYGAEIGLAIAAATGVSSGTANTVPAMLLPVSVGPSSLAKLGELCLEGDENVHGHLCARLRGRNAANEPTTLWIDRDTYLLRHIVERYEKFETTTSYEPSLDPIDLGSIERPDIVKTPPQPKQPTPRTGIRIATGSTRVEKIDEDSPASRSGLAIGDEVKAVNGQTTSRFVDVFKAIRVVKIGEQLALTIRRGGSTLDVQMRVEAYSRDARPAPVGPLLE